MTSLLVIHDLGSAGGAPWEEAFRAWPGTVVAPDLPGHGTAPAPPGGHYEAGDAVFALAEHLPAADAELPVVVGVGCNGHGARILAVAGRAAALVLVDGLGGPWLDVAERNAAVRALRRRILDTPAALAPHHSGSTDPRATLVLPTSDRAHAVRVCESVPVPTLVVETPQSPTPDAYEVVSAFPDAELTRTDSTRPAQVAEAVTTWWSGRLP